MLEILDPAVVAGGVMVVNVGLAVLALVAFTTIPPAAR